MPRCLLRLTAGVLASRRPLPGCGNATHFLTDAATEPPQFVSHSLSLLVLQRGCGSLRLLPAALPHISTSLPCCASIREGRAAMPGVKHLQRDQSRPGEVRTTVITGLCRAQNWLRGSVSSATCCQLPRRAPLIRRAKSCFRAEPAPASVSG
ncbi:hypothetical protein NDU88_002812 [Pleurodeles waltl]|uniref:Uncharacterized protein n=1 Tax=Pleurodeles waltl TaxID=8319 RepID=A0AAV7TLP7_PLEWA|nr:hypothetical protein NDU88_002812 [Pleurodeles waltl]